MVPFAMMIAAEEMDPVAPARDTGDAARAVYGRDDTRAMVSDANATSRRTKDENDGKRIGQYSTDGGIASLYYTGNRVVPVLAPCKSSVNVSSS